MNDLQITLLIVGGGGIAAMIAYNWWQDYRLRKQASERFGDNQQDPLLQTDAASSPSGKSAQRTEPGFAASALSDNTEFEKTPAEIPDVLSATSHDTELDNLVQDGVDKRLFADFVIRFDEPKDANTWKPLVDGLDQINRKRIVYSACPHLAQDGRDVLWFKAMPYVGTAQALRASVQIANRKGPLSSIEFSEVLAKLRRFAEEHNAELEFPEMKDVVARAETLDQAAAALDTLLGLHCLLPESVPESTATERLVQSGWIQKGHQWALQDELSATLATMVIHNAPGKKLLSFSIDVPNSPDPVKALGDIVTVCHGLNSEFGAPLMDDSGRTLSTQAIEGIYKQLIERVRNLSDSGFKPGALASRILFS
ncbi:MAG TPA: hypothetical protein VFV57_08785 [Limnobacter sp.]|nr:hypothetical protein [Limnobacter sp.]